MRLRPELDRPALSAGTNTGERLTVQNGEERDKSEQPLGTFKLGDAVLTLGGFVDLENIFRTTNTQSNIATSFGSIPYSNTPQGNVSEFRTTAQYSRLSAKVTDRFRGNDVTAYLEGDFSGNSAPGVYQSVNPQTGRLRLYFVDIKHSKWEVLGGTNMELVDPEPYGNRTNA